MSVVRTKGIIIRQSDYGEGHRMLSIFTSEYGIIKAVKYGAKSTKNRDSAASQFLCYGEFELYISNRDVGTVNSIIAKETFFPITEDIEKLSLCNYFADLTYSILGMNNPDERLLSVFLNCVYALAYKNEPPKKVKAVYELKLMTIGGYMPNLVACKCGQGKICGFDVFGGEVVCDSCKKNGAILLSPNTYKAMWYIVNCEDKKILSFNGNEKLIEEVGNISEKYVLAHIEKEFKSLDYYKAISEF